MSLPGISIRRPVFAWMIMAGLILFGVLSFLRMGVSLLPDVDFPNISVNLQLPGAAPAIMEGQVVDPIEDSLMTIDGVRTITSTSQDSSAIIQIEFDLNRNIDEAVEEVQDHINQINNILPTGLFPAQIRKQNPEDMPILWLAVTANNVPPMEQMIFTGDYLYNQFATIPNVGNIAEGGFTAPALRVWLDQNKLQKWNLAAGDVVNAIKTEHVEIPAGSVENALHEYNVRVMGEAPNPKEFGKIRVETRSVLGPNYNHFVRLSNLGYIEEGTQDVRRLSRFDGVPAIGLGIIKQHGSNAVTIANAVRARLKEIIPTLPKQYQVSLRNDTTRFIKQSVSELTFNLIMSALLTSLVCFLFLGSWTSTLNVLLAIPTSIIGAFIVLYFLGFTLNTFTLLGLSLAIGVVVDDAIMMLENIVRHHELGEPRRIAALNGAEEITFAALASSLAVVAIFLPVVFMKGVIGRYLYQFGVTVSIAVMLSLLEALTLTPMRCSRFLQVSHGADRSHFANVVDNLFSRLSSGYKQTLEVLLNRRWWVISTALTVFVCSLALVRYIPQEMLPPQDQSNFLLRFKGPVGAALPYTNGKFKIAEKYLAAIPEINGVFSIVGGFSNDAVNQGFMFVSLVDKDKRKKSQDQVMNEVRNHLNQTFGRSMHVIAQDMSLRGFSSSRGFPVEIIVQGPDWDVLTKNTFRLMEAMRKSGVFKDVNTDIQKNDPEIEIIPDRAKLAHYAVSASAVTNDVNTLIGGDIINGQTEYPKEGHRYEIEVRLLAQQRDRQDQLKHIFVRNNRGELISIDKVVKFVKKPTLTVITRVNRQRAIIVYANTVKGVSQARALAKAQELGQKMLPKGYYVKLTGASVSFKESMESLIFALGLGILISYMILASQFNSFIHPITVLMALPFSMTGAFIGLLLFHQSINIYSLIGLILLMGIVKKNSILMVDFTNQCRGEGASVRDALLKACPVRLRPILMTSVATIAGALPEALAIGPGSETAVPMAISIIGGVALSTFLTLFVVPCAYSLLATMERKVH